MSLASEYGRYGYRRITALLRTDGWRVNHKRVERIWRQEGLSPSGVGCGSHDGSCVRLRPQHRNHVWAYDFVFDRTRDRAVNNAMLPIQGSVACFMQLASGLDKQGGADGKVILSPA